MDISQLEAKILELNEQSNVLWQASHDTQKHGVPDQKENRRLYDESVHAWIHHGDLLHVSYLLERSGIDHERFQEELPEAFQSFVGTYAHLRGGFVPDVLHVDGRKKMFAAADYDRKTAVLAIPSSRAEHETYIDSCGTFHGVAAAHKTWYHYGTKVVAISPAGTGYTFVEHWNDERMHGVGCALKPARFEKERAMALNDEMRPKRATIESVRDDLITVKLYGEQTAIAEIPIKSK